MTDDEIIKALECCNNNEDCRNCPLQKDLPHCDLVKPTFDLIRRQQAEIERLNDLFNKAEIIIRPEAIEEFKDRLKTRIDKIIFKYGHYCESEEIGKLVEDIDSIAEAMIGDTYEHN